jgi:protein subunit release factor A
MVFDAEVNRRALQDARYAELSTEIAAIDVQISALAQAAGHVRKKTQAALAATYADYLAECEEAARVDALAQTEITPLQNRSVELQQQLRTLVQPRLSERELTDVAIYNSASAVAQRQTPARNA